MSLNAKNIIKYGSIFIVSIGIVIYVFLQAGTYITGPQLEITDPHDGFYTNNPFIMIKGTVQNVSFLSLNNEQIYHNEEGDFEEKLLLSPGYNIIEVKATDRFDRSIKKRVQVILDYDNTLGIDTFKKSTSTPSTEMGLDTATSSPETNFATSSDNIVE